MIFRIEQILIKENPRKAGEILREAAEMGNLPSQESLSFLYLKNWDNAKSTDSTNDEMIDFMENNAEYFYDGKTPLDFTKSPLLSTF